MKNHDLVYLTALDVREWTEDYQKNSPHASRYWDGCGGLCAIASVKLMEQLAVLNIKAKFVANSSHCFLLVDDHIVDITATQFQRGHRPIVIWPKDSPHAQEQYFWKQNYICENLEQVDLLLKERGWPKHQYPLINKEKSCIN